LERGLAIEHFTPSDLIINTAQMRDSESLNAFRWIPDALIASNIIREAAETMYAEHQRQKKAQLETEIDVVHLDSIEPAPKRSRPSNLNLVSSRQAPSSLRRVAAATYGFGNDPQIPNGLTFANNQHLSIPDFWLHLFV
jgi:hypothetical protein